MVNEDEVNYINERNTSKSAEYNWHTKTSFFPIAYKMIAIKSYDMNQLLKIREKNNIPLNVMLVGVFMLHLDEVKVKDEELEKILSNYYKFHLDINYKLNELDEEQFRNLLLSLPENLSDDYEVEQLQNYQKICDEKILHEFEQTENVNALRNMLLEVKVKDLEGLKRDLYFYKKYLGEKAESNEIFNLFQILFNSCIFFGIYNHS